MSPQPDNDAPAPPDDEGGRRIPGFRTLLALAVASAAVAWSVPVAREAAAPGYKWLRLVRAGDVERRREAAANLGDLQGPVAVWLRPRTARALADALGDPDRHVAVAAAGSLARVVLAEPDDAKARAWSALLIAGTRDPRPEVREATAQALGMAARPSPAVSDALAAALEDPAPEVRSAAAVALGRVGAGGRGLEALARALGDDPEALVQTAAAGSLAEYSDDPDAATLALLRGAGSPRGEVRLASAAALLKLQEDRRPRSAAIVPALTRATADPDRDVRTAAALALGGVGPAAVDAVPALIAMLHDQDALPARAGAPVLVATPDVRGVLGATPDAVPLAGPLRSASGGPGISWGPAVQAAEALGRVAPGTAREAEAAAALGIALERYPGATPRRFAACLALASFPPPFARQAVGPMAALLATHAPNKYYWLAGRADELCATLGRLAPDSPAEARAVEALTRALGYRWSGAPAAAADALGNMGRHAAAALPRLREMRARTTAYESAPELPRHVEAAIGNIEQDAAVR